MSSLARSSGAEPVCFSPLLEPDDFTPPTARESLDDPIASKVLISLGFRSATRALP